MYITKHHVHSLSPATYMLLRGTQPCPGRMVACREGLTKGHCLQEPSQKTLPPPPPTSSGLEARERVLRYLNSGLEKENY